ncbi:UbiX family flavin prenyltransferase [Halarcobacter anaerophilus]|uniref:Flavin prenyltransferase UbiX n=1 Tax=Halarcobacter anaerophilus TaxID=877500 RepID=A0A4Q0Y4L4_9BACT|nr:UbiX family flavin prenyltransferase [Halarcobacter anaerophilus]QDF29254.1 3-octaprenyl-4-hydroxybenzoate carboxy-lyase [Halarcobacter anaerophilus]RXJ64505.1 3-octaprenyl-4-hydroxybenzoate carboxy-lyase [Halarcobacter anaerophilus]
MKLVVAITGASGARLAVKFIQNLPKSVEAFIVISRSAEKSLKLEDGIDLKEVLKDSGRFHFFKENEIEAPISSGSFKTDKMIILPCSMNTLAKCAVGISDNLITRAFTVMFKEKREIILAPREMPFSAIALENMHKLSQLGVIIAPPVLAYYSKQNSLELMEDFMIGKWFDLLKIEHNLYERWK